MCTADSQDYYTVHIISYLIHWQLKPTRDTVHLQLTQTRLKHSGHRNYVVEDNTAMLTVSKSTVTTPKPFASGATIKP